MYRTHRLGAMTWVRLEDEMPLHPKVAPLGDRAFRLHVSGICYCARFLTDGKVPAAVVRTLIHGDHRKPLRELVAAKLWHDEGTHYEINDYLEYNPPASTVKRKAQVNKERAKQAARARWNGAHADASEHAHEHAHEHEKDACEHAWSDARAMPQSPVPLRPTPTSPNVVDDAARTNELAPVTPAAAIAETDTRFTIKDPTIPTNVRASIYKLARMLPDSDPGTIGRLVKAHKRDGATQAVYEAVAEHLASLDIKPHSPSRWACDQVNKIARGAA